MSLLVYGAYGYTGRLVTERAVDVGLTPIVAGRDRTRVVDMATRYGLQHRVFSLANPEAVARALDSIDTVVHCAGPFVDTAQPMVAACLQTGTHYLDITGEVEVFEALADQDDHATEAGIVLLPGVGFDVVPTDCLAAHVHEQVPNAHTLDLAFMGLGRVSQGTLRTAVGQMGAGGVVRRNGALQTVPPGWTTRTVDFGADGPGERTVISIPWGDLATAYRSTHIPNITTYTYLPQTARTLLQLSRYVQWLLQAPIVQTLLERWVEQLPAGPSADEREEGETFVWANARTADGTSATARLRGPEGYTFTAHAAVAAAQHVLRGDVAPGYQTPATALGADFVLSIDGVSREDL